MGFRSSRSDQGASPLEPDRQGAGAEYLRSGKGVSPFPPGGGGSTVDRQAGTGAAHRSGRRPRRLFCRRRALPAPAAAGGHARNLQMLTI